MGLSASVLGAANFTVIAQLAAVVIVMLAGPIVVFLISAQEGEL